MSFLVLIAFVSAASAMTIVGPRVYASMAADGYLPSLLRAEEGRPPVTSIILQCAVALLILATHTLQEALVDVGAILTLFAALVSVSVFRRAFTTEVGLEKPDRLTLLAAAVHVASSAFMLYFGFRNSTGLLIWVGVVAVAGLSFWAMARPRSPKPTP